MDELRTFFNNPCPSTSQVIKLRRPLTGGHRITKTDPSLQLNRREEHRHSVFISGTDYVREIKERENENYIKNEEEREKCESVSGGLDSMEHLSSWGSSIQNLGELTDEAMTQVYTKYSFQKKEETNKLAINEYRQHILDQISGFRVVIIEGPTGCGKTTQVPQWILDDAYQHCRPCNIVVTQPRKIAAISIAKRVAQERGWDVGGIVGYQIALDSVKSSDTRITYVTTGVLLSKLVSAKTMSEYTHIILDEVHERGQEMDFLLVVVKKLLYSVSRNVKVILMSATFNRKLFSDYFLLNMPQAPLKPSCVKVVKKEPMFTVKIFYLNQLNKFGSVLNQSVPKFEEPSIAPTMNHLVIKLINAFEQIDTREDNITDRSEAEIPSVLIFLPGIHEIEDLYECLTNLELRKSIATECATYKWWVLPLHSTITADEQTRVFQRAPLGSRKIILSTNIAESSITVPDVKYVIDFCLMKIMVADEMTNFTMLKTTWASKTNCEQRAGRAGRVRDGRVYRLVTDKFYENFSQDCPPEIVRCPLERLVLLAKMLDMGPPGDVLALAMDPPDMSNIHRTVLVLKEIGALKKNLDDKWCSYDGEITHLGRIMVQLPLDVRVSKLIVLGYIFGVLEESVVMAAAMSVKNVFNSPFRERLNAYNSKLTWADGSTSDCIAFLNVYKVWNHLRQQQFFKQADNNEHQWARRFFVQLRALRELDALARELRVRLSRLGLDCGAERSPWAKHELPLVYKIILAGAFYPQYFVQVTQNEDRERDAVRTLGGLNPRNTVYLRNFPRGQPADVYAAAIRNIVGQQIGDQPRVTIDKSSQKVYLSFVDDEFALRNKKTSGDPTIPGQVVLPVYKAIKARHLKMDIRIPLLPLEKAESLANALAESKANVNVSSMVPRLPDIDDTHFPIKISHVINVGNFWAQYDDESTRDELAQIHSELNNKPLLAYTGNVAAELLAAAPFADATGSHYYRAKVVKVLPRDTVELLYVDYGSVGRMSASRLCSLSARARRPAPLAMRCALSGLAPAALLHAHANWAPGALRLLYDLIAKPRLLAKVYSVTQGVVSVELLADSGQININKALIAKGFAVPSEESFESKLNHDLRQTATELNLAQKRAYNKEQAELAFCPAQDVGPLDYKECVTDACLKGPYSPLETTLHNLMYSSREKQVAIESSSVNSVLLDTAPQEIYQRLLVAGDVGQNESTNKLTLRHTTLMPNIPCLPAIISLLFCPVAELRRHEDGSRYVSVLCGLGARGPSLRAAPHFPEHDLLVDIDADLAVDDIGLINHIRHLMDYMMDGSEEAMADDKIRPNVPKIIRKDLLELLLKRRKHREPVTVVNAWEWKSVPEEELLEITVPDMVERAVVFPLHAPLELRPRPREALLALKRDNDELKLLVARTTSNVERPCLLCGTAPMPISIMRIHLYSNAHKDKEEDLRIFRS